MGASFPGPWIWLKAEPSSGPHPPKLWDGCGAALAINGHHPFLIRKITKKMVSESMSQINLNNMSGEIQSLKTETPTRARAPARLEGKSATTELIKIRVLPRRARSVNPSSPGG